MPGSLAVFPQTFEQKRLKMFFSKGKAFYAEYNLRLFFFLLFHRMDAICAIDLDSIVPCLLVSILRHKPRVYDAHELFTELKEVVSRPLIHMLWLKIEQFAVPKFRIGYSVNQFIVDEFRNRYGVSYLVIRNLPKKRLASVSPGINYSQSFLDVLPRGRFILYQGAVNEGRSFETLIPAMQQIDLPLVIAGDGNFMSTVKHLITDYAVEHKVICLGAVPPEVLRLITERAFCGLTLFENAGMNQYYSLANRFFDYIQAGIPQVCVDYPEYRSVNDQYDIAVLISDLSPASLSATLNKLAEDDVISRHLRRNCGPAAEALCWDIEKEKLVNLYRDLLM